MAVSTSWRAARASVLARSMAVSQRRAAASASSGVAAAALASRYAAWSSPFVTATARGSEAPRALSIRSCSSSSARFASRMASAASPCALARAARLDAALLGRGAGRSALVRRPREGDRGRCCRRGRHRRWLAGLVRSGDRNARGGKDHRRPRFVHRAPDPDVPLRRGPTAVQHGGRPRVRHSGGGPRPVRDGDRDRRRDAPRRHGVVPWIAVHGGSGPSERSGRVSADDGDGHGGRRQQRRGGWNACSQRRGGDECLRAGGGRDPGGRADDRRRAGSKPSGHAASTGELGGEGRLRAAVGSESVTDRRAAIEFGAIVIRTSRRGAGREWTAARNAAPSAPPRMRPRARKAISDELTVLPC